jgi:hypothetical protein
MPERFCVWAIIGTRKLSDSSEGGSRDAVSIRLSLKHFGASSNSAGRGKNRGPTLLDRHSEVRTLITKNARKENNRDVIV